MTIKLYGDARRHGKPMRAMKFANEDRRWRRSLADAASLPRKLDRREFTSRGRSEV
jgi:hypothetical protein